MSQICCHSLPVLWKRVHVYINTWFICLTVEGAHQHGVKGWAVLEARSKCKVEVCKKALLQSREFLRGMSESVLDVAEMDVLTVSTVNSNLLTEPPAGIVLEEYMYYKLLLGERFGPFCYGL